MISNILSYVIPTVNVIATDIHIDTVITTRTVVTAGVRYYFILLIPFYSISIKCWVLETYYGDSDIAKTLQIGLYNNDNRSYYEKTGKVNGVIDIDAKAEDVEVEDVNMKKKSNNRELNPQRKDEK